MELLLILVILLLAGSGLELYFKCQWSKGLKVQVTFSKKEAVSGDELSIKEIVMNKNHVFMPYVELKYEIHNNGVPYQNRQEIFSLVDRQKVTRTVGFPCENRGVYDISQIYIVSKGLFLRSLYEFQAKSESRLIVYPRLSDVSGITIRAAAHMGEEKSDVRLVEDRFAYQGVREYSSQDSITKVNWNATAQTGKLQVNTYEDTRHTSVKLILQLPDQLVKNAKTLSELDISIAASLFLKCLEEKISVSMQSNGTDVMTGFPVHLAERRDEAYKKIVLETFARISTQKLNEQSESQSALHQQAGMTIVLISQMESEGRVLVQQSLELGKRDTELLWIIASDKNEESVEAMQKLMRKYGAMGKITIYPWWNINE